MYLSFGKLSRQLTVSNLPLPTSAYSPRLIVIHNDRKTFTDGASVSHGEDVAPAPKPELADPARRQSVALNIVENSLKVSFAISSLRTSCGRVEH
jgi:hypothetical protein